jgi:regulator of cell morphogenesis and NO signaling
MYQTHKTYIKSDTKVADLISENPRFLLFLEHMQIEFAVNEKTVLQLCSEHSIPVSLFLHLGNLYNEFHPEKFAIETTTDILLIIRFLRNTHHYYKTDKYPEIMGFIKELQMSSGNEEVMMIERFFNDYFDEVLQHLDYEDDIAFPYFTRLVQTDSDISDSHFSVNEYGEHHTDIETKLVDLKNLLLKHVRISNQIQVQRKLLISLLELELDLKIHAQIEETILLPLVTAIEKSRRNG